MATPGDGITNDNTPTLTGTARCQQHGAGIRRLDAARDDDRQQQRSMDLYDRPTVQRHASNYGDGDHLIRQHKQPVSRRINNWCACW